MISKVTFAPPVKVLGQRKFFLGCREYRRLTQSLSSDEMLNPRHIGRFHESKIAYNSEKPHSQIFYPHTFFISHLPGIRRRKGQNDYPFVKDFVKPEEMQKSARHPSG
jgi:hypothetical protein